MRVVLCREPGRGEGFDVALLTTDTEAAAEDVVARYAERWAIGVCFQDAKQVIGVGEARNRSERAVRRTVPFGFLCQTIVIAWYTLHGEAEADVEHRRRAPWYRDKRAPATADMLTSLRRELIRARFSPPAGRRLTPTQISQPAQPSESSAA
ncbi:MAG: hypothetical protein C4306_00805 [Thermoleophilia bacterium]